jgi:hypothetical protein
MRRDFLRQIERRIAPRTSNCILFIHDAKQPTGIQCHYTQTTIPLEECPGYNGQECPYSTGSQKVHFVRVRAGPNGEVQRYGSPEWPYEEGAEDDVENIFTVAG